MTHLWTIVFVTLLAIAFCIAAWHDREDKAGETEETSLTKREFRVMSKCSREAFGQYILSGRPRHLRNQHVDESV